MKGVTLLQGNTHVFHIEICGAGSMQIVVLSVDNDRFAYLLDKYRIVKVLPISLDSLCCICS
jgi:hypothetical protein